MAVSSSKLHRFDVVEVTWVDCEKEDDWTDFASYRLNTPPTMVSVGYFYGQDKEVILLFQTMDRVVPATGDGLFDSILKIPKRQVENVRIIRRFKPKKLHEPKYDTKR